MIQPHEVTHIGLFRLVLFVNWRPAINPVMTSFSAYCIMPHIDCESKICVSIFLLEFNSKRLLLKRNEKRKLTLFPSFFCWDIPKSLSSGLTKSNSFAFLSLTWLASLIKRDNAHLSKQKYLVYVEMLIGRYLYY